MGKGSTETKNLRRKSYLLISRMSQIDPRMIQSRSEGIRSDDRSQRQKVLRLPRRSEDRMVIRLDPRYGSIILVESRLSIAAGDTRGCT